MKIAVLQYPIVWADKETNLRLTMERLATLVGKADVALLPEMFTTGFCTDRPDLAEPVDGKTITSLQRYADESGVAVAGSFICREKDGLHNRGFFVAPNEKPVFIDKAHLYQHSHEDEFFVAGRSREAFEYKGVKFRLIICYDLRFPAWDRNKSGWDYDILLVSANWPECRIQYWDALTAARATENQCYICAANPVGNDGMGMHYNGHSIAYDTRLRPLIHFADDEEGIQIADFDIETLHHFREALPLWKDADTYTIH